MNYFRTLLAMCLKFHIRLDKTGLTFLLYRINVTHNWSMSQGNLNNIRARIAKNVYKYRTSRNMIREKLSLLLDMDNSYISKLERGKINATIDKIEAIANCLEIDVVDLFKE